MVTLAFLFAVFRRRPSPFYMMDEVEAALDDVNLQRFLSLVDEFREEAQLLIVTHQKRTMEAADALYGVTMVPGGSSKVVSQRVNAPRGSPGVTLALVLVAVAVVLAVAAVVVARRRRRAPVPGVAPARPMALVAEAAAADAGGAPGRVARGLRPGARDVRARSATSSSTSSRRSCCAATSAWPRPTPWWPGCASHGAPEGVASALRASLLASFVRRALAHDDRRARARAGVALRGGQRRRARRPPIGKLARRLALEGRSVVLAAGDTFRAAAAEQLELWAERTGADVVRAAEGADPGSVVHDALGRAAARGADIVLADTAGRRANSANLLEELAKVRRVADRAPGQVVETLMVLDATTGQNALAQAREFLRRGAGHRPGADQARRDRARRDRRGHRARARHAGQVRRGGRGAPTTSSTSTPRRSWSRCWTPSARR